MQTTCALCSNAARTICNRSLPNSLKPFFLLGSSWYLTTTAQSWTFPQYFWQFPFFMWVFCPVVTQASAINRLYTILSIQSFWAQLKVAFTGKCLPLARMELKRHKLLFTAVEGILVIILSAGSNWDSWKNYLLFILLIFQKDSKDAKRCWTQYSQRLRKKQTLVMANGICQNSLRELFSDIWYIFNVFIFITVIQGWDQLACWGHVHW